MTQGTLEAVQIIGALIFLFVYLIAVLIPDR